MGFFSSPVVVLASPLAGSSSDSNPEKDFDDKFNAVRREIEQKSRAMQSDKAGAAAQRPKHDADGGRDGQG